MLTIYCPSRYAFAVIASIFTIPALSLTKASIAVGQGGAMLLPKIVSMPVTIRMQALQINTQFGSTDFGLSAAQRNNQSENQAENQPTNKLANKRWIESSGSGFTLVELDSDGVAGFSVSKYIASGDVVKTRSDENSAGQSETAASANMTTNGDTNELAESLVPAQSPIGGGRLSIVISQASAKG